MNYVEMAKSIALTVLILLSITLTFTIWNFTPSYDTLEPTPAIDVSLGETKKLEQVVQPMKTLYHYENQVTGTNEPERIDTLLNAMRQWKIVELVPLEDGATPEEMKSLMHAPGRTVLYYPTTIPYPVFDTIMDITDSTVSESTFDRMVIEWGSVKNGEITIYFINSSTGRISEGTVQITEFENFREAVIEPAENYTVYITNENIGVLPVYIPENAVDETGYTYLYEEIAVESFAKGLFEGTNIEPAGTGLTGEYIDENGARIGPEQSRKSINYLQPQAETPDPAVPSELLFNTFGFINEHGGWTNEYHYFGMDPLSQLVEYQLFLNNMPVFSSSLMTEMEVKWGIADGREQVFSYTRPYYVLEPTERTMGEEQASGKEVIDMLFLLDEEERAAISDVVPSYELVRSSTESDRLMYIKPAWHFKMNGEWTKLSAEALGGEPSGLE